MTDVVIVPADVQANGNGQILNAGVAITAGQALFKDKASGDAMLSKTSDEDSASFVGIALNNASVGQPVNALKSGLITLGTGTVVQGEGYALSATAGMIAPIADKIAGEVVTVLGVAPDTTTINLTPILSGVIKA